MRLQALNELFRIAPGPISLLLFVRMALAVGLPLIGFTLAGQPLAGVVGGTVAMFVSMCDVGATRRGRVGTMLLGLGVMAACGIAGDKWGGSTRIDELLVIGSVFIAAWVSNSQPGLATVARFGAVATAAGVGMQIANPLAAAAIALGGASAIGVAYALWVLFDVAPDKDFMDWRAGLRRALAGADAGPRFAICAALTAALSLLAADALGVNRPYWATITTILVMRREGMVSLKLTLQYMLGTLLGIPVAAGLWQLSATPLLVALLVALLAASMAACWRLGMALNPALGFASFTVFLVLVADLAQHELGSPTPLLAARLYDVAVGCAFAIVGTLLATAWHRSAQRSRGR